MGQKINPVSLRLQYTNRHFDSCWYSEHFYKNLITRDLFLQHYLNNFLKLLKLPAGRYSIQHLQKKTQIYNFLCIPKSTREWRAKLFGFTKSKNLLKKNRYFFKKKTDIFNFSLKKNKKMRKQTKLNCFYITLNQLAVHQIQKKITSFQNFRLWSALLKTKQKAIINNSRDMVSLPPYYDLILFDLKKKGVCRFPRKVLFPQLPLRVPQLSFFLQAKRKRVPQLPLFLETKRKPEEKTAHLKNSSLNKQSDDSKLLFLQNLFIYKTLKARLITKKELQSPFKIEETAKRHFFFDQKENRDPKQHLVNSLSPSSIKIEGSLIPVLVLLGNKEKGRKKKEKDSFSPLSNFQTLESKYENYLESSLSSLHQLDLDLISFKVKNDWQYAGFLADEIVSLLEKRIAFRRLKSKLIKQLSKVSAIRGVRITCSGRVGGKSKKAQRAKIESLKYGQTSLHVFSAPIDFSCKTARTSFGSVGVKVWICYQENLNTDSFGVQKEGH